MTTNDRHDVSSTEAGLEHDLRALKRHEQRDEEFKRDLRELLLAYVRTDADSERNKAMAIASLTMEVHGSARPLPWLTRLRLLLVAALALAAGGTATYLRTQGVPGHANTRPTVAVTAPALPGQVVYEMAQYYGLNTTFGLGSQPSPTVTDTVEQWTQYAANGTISRQAQLATSPQGTLLFRALRLGHTFKVYVPRFKTVETGGIPRGQNVSAIDSPMQITDLRAFEAGVRHGAFPYTRLLPPIHLEGVPVHVIEYRGIEPLPKGAPKGIKPAQDVWTWYYEPGSYAIRGHDEVWIDGHGVTHAQVRLRVTTRRIVPIASVPADAFTLRAPGSAHLIAQNSLASVAHAVAAPYGATPLLARDLYGLQLYELDADTYQGQPRFSYRYSVGARTFGNFDRRVTLIVQISRRLSSEPAISTPPPTGASWQLISTRIDGRVVQARYMTQLTDNAGLTHNLFYAQGSFDVEISGLDMTRQQFFAILATLVDGHTHPAVVTHLQAELDAP